MSSATETAIQNFKRQRIQAKKQHSKEALSDRQGEALGWKGTEVTVDSSYSRERSLMQ